MASPDFPGHFEMDETVELDGVFEGNFFGYRFDKAVDQESLGVVSGNAARFEEKYLLLADFLDRGFMFDDRVVSIDGHRGIGIASTCRIEHHGVAGDVCFCAARVFSDMHESSIGGLPAVLGDGFGEYARGGPWCQMIHLAAGVLVLPGAREGDRKHVAMRSFADQIHGRIFHGDFASDIAVDPFHNAVRLGARAFGDEVVDVVAPILHGSVADARSLVDEDFDDSRVKGIG